MLFKNARNNIVYAAWETIGSRFSRLVLREILDTVKIALDPTGCLLLLNILLKNPIAFFSHANIFQSKTKYHTLTNQYHFEQFSQTY